MPKKWCSSVGDAVNEIRGMVEDGCRLDDVCRRFGISRATVKTFCRAHGVRWPRGKHPDVDLRLRVMNLVARGFQSCGAIAREMGVHRSHALRIVREMESAGALTRSGRGRGCRIEPSPEWRLQKRRADGDGRAGVEWDGEDHDDLA